MCTVAINSFQTGVVLGKLVPLQPINSTTKANRSLCTNALYEFLGSPFIPEHGNRPTTFVPAAYNLACELLVPPSDSSEPDLTGTG